jgi:hypothetical protein
VPQQGRNEKRERQYEHVRDGLEARGRTEDVAEEIAARTVNNESGRENDMNEADVRYWGTVPVPPGPTPVRTLHPPLPPGPDYLAVSTLRSGPCGSSPAGPRHGRDRDDGHRPGHR